MKLQKFDYQIKDNKKNRSFVVVSVLIVALVVGVVLYKSFAAYKVTESYNIIKGSVGEFTNDSLEITYNLVSEDGGIMTTSVIPSSTEYEYDEAKSSCVNGNTIVYDENNNTINIGDNSEGVEDTCNIYFDYIPLSLRTLYALNLTDDDILTGVPYGPDGTGVDGYYAAEDDYGTSYYYYSNENSKPIINVAGTNWFLLRINGNGTIRLIASQTTLNSVYNQNNNDNAYLGYMYGEVGSSSILNTQNNTTNSSIKVSIGNYYTQNIGNSEYFADTLFCNDRSVYKEDYGQKETDDTALGYGNNTTYYGSYYRIRNNTPSLKCGQKSDSFTVEESDIGNGLLDIPVALPTADELYMTNASWYTNNALGTPITMSPVKFKDNIAYVYQGNNTLNAIDVNTESNIYLVVNLKAGLKFSGDFINGYTIVNE